MNGCQPNRNAIEMQTNHNDCHNESLVLKCQQLLEYLNQTDSEGKVGQILTSDIKSVISTLRNLLQDENIDNLNIQHNALIITKSILTTESVALRKERALLLISDNDLMTNLLRLEHNFIEKNIQYEALIEIYYQVMAKISSHKKYSYKIDANHKSSLVNSLCVLERWKHKHKIVIAIFSYLKHLLKSPLCAPILCRDPNESFGNINLDNGLINVIYDILCTSKSISYTSIHAIETLAIICRCKEGISAVLKIVSFYISVLVKHFEDCRLLFTQPKADKKNILKSLRFSYSILGVFLHLSYIKSGREHLIHSSIDQNILSFMNTIVEKNIRSEKAQHLDRVFLLSSMVIQRCLDPMPLPLCSHFNPNQFEIPFSEESLTKQESRRICDGNECSVEIDDNYDYYSSDQSDTDNESYAPTDNESMTSMRESDDIVSYEQYFPEIKFFGWNFETDSNQIMLNECNDESLNRRKNLKSWLCSCFSNNQNSNDSSAKHEEILDLKHHENCNDSHNTRKEVIDVKQLILSAKEEKRKDLFMETADWRHVYSSMASKTISIQPLLTLTEPDLTGNIGYTKLEPLEMSESDDMYGLARIKLMEHIRDRFRKNIDKTIIVYDTESEYCCLKDRLQFDSRFESGNLRKVIQNEPRPNQYTLLLNTDINTYSHVQWFYFKVSNMKPNVEYVFNIINCEKQSSLYNEGQRPVMFSCKESLVNDRPFWKRVGYSIAYYRNHYVKDSTIASVINGKTYYTLTFKIKFSYENDVCYLAYNYPYTYTYLRSNIHFWQNCHNCSNVYFRHQTLCTSLTGNDVPLLTITSSKKSRNPTVPQYIVLIGRVHPGESNSSWILKGCIDFLLSDKISAQRLLERYVFKIIPMINPDGVINGCSRTGAQGDDLNRQWSRPHPLLHPTIFHSKSLLKYLSHISKNSNPMLLVDFHGHSRRKNIFLYGCSPKMSWKKSDLMKNDDQSYLALPLILNSVAPAFSLENCCYTIEKNRERTARITIWRELDLKSSYTLECSQAGCDQGVYNDMHLGINQLTEMGSKFCSALLKLELISDGKSSRLIPIVPKELLVEADHIFNKSPDDSSEEQEENDSF